MVENAKQTYKKKCVCRVQKNFKTKQNNNNDNTIGVSEKDDTYAKWLGNSWVVVLSAFGSSVLVTTLLGLTGSCYENRYALRIYFTILLILTLGEITVVILALTIDFKSILKERWNELNDQTKVHSKKNKKKHKNIKT